MKNVFVETNWVVAAASPFHLRVPAAIRLKEMARLGEIQLHLPSICLTEAQYPIRSKYQPRAAADMIRKYLAAATTARDLDSEEIQTVRRALDIYESRVSAELDGLKTTLDEFRNVPGMEVFPLDEHMLRRSVELSTQQLDLKPYDQAILSAVLVRAEQLRSAAEPDSCFCELDGDLQPWDRKGNSKEPLTSLYNQSGIWVYGDFAMKNPERPADWPPPS